MIGLACPHGSVPGRLFDWLCRFLPARLGEDLVIAQVDGESEVAHANNLLAARFLASDYARLWLVAADLVPYAATHSILDADADIATGLSYVEQVDPLDTEGYLAGPNFVRFDADSVWSWRQLGWAEIGDAPLQNTAGGMHCAVIRREVFALPGVELAPGAWYRTHRDAAGRRTMSDDIDFCWRAMAAGASVVAYPGAVSGHLKTVDIGALWRSAVACGRRMAAEEVA